MVVVGQSALLDWWEVGGVIVSTVDSLGHCGGREGTLPLSAGVVTLLKVSSNWQGSLCITNNTLLSSEGLPRQARPAQRVNNLI